MSPADQRTAALEYANRIRVARAELKRDIKSNPRRAAEVLADPPPYAERMTLVDLLLALPGWGRWRVREVLRRNQIAGAVRLAHLSPSTRQQLVATVEQGPKVRR